jgi:hypothetical protein
LEVETVLRGSLDTFALPDVLTLLAGSAKSGELNVTGPAGSGRVWLDRGQIVEAEAGGTSEALAAVVHLLRMGGDGEFEFDGDVAAPDPGPATAVDEVLAAAAEQLAEWQEIEAVLPSQLAWLALVPEAPRAALKLTAGEWSAVVALGRGCSVAQAVEAVGGGALSASRVLKGLVEAGLVAVEVDEEDAVVEAVVAEPAEVSPPAAAEVEEREVAEAPFVPAPGQSDLVRHLSSLAPPAREQDPDADGGAPAAEPIARPVAETDGDATDEPAPSAPAAGPASQPVNRGTLLKFLSSVRT